MKSTLLRALLLLLLVVACNCHFHLFKPFPHLVRAHDSSEEESPYDSIATPSDSGNAGDSSSGSVEESSGNADESSGNADESSGNADDSSGSVSDSSTLSVSSESQSAGSIGESKKAKSSATTGVADFGSQPLDFTYGFGPDESAAQSEPLDIKDFGKLDPGTGPGFKGAWEMLTEDSGVSAMHLQLLPKVNKVAIFDATIWHISNIKLNDGKPCRPVVDDHGKPTIDCWAHSVLMDIETGKLEPLRIELGDTWCSSGGLAVDGTLVSSGGWQAGANTVRYLGPCDGGCKWKEYPNTLAAQRWYSTQIMLPDGRFMVFGGRGSMNYEFIPKEGQKNPKAIDFPFLKETSDPLDWENNLYPFVYLSTDGNVFIFANTRSVLLNPQTLKVVHEFPKLPNGARNYPSTGCSALLPLVLKPNQRPGEKVKAEVLVCGGNQPDAYVLANPPAALKKKKVFKPALDDCGRIEITDLKANWLIEKMPSRRLMGDMMILPTGDALILNGAKEGSAAWFSAQKPNFNPVLYKTTSTGERFRTLAPSTIPRMYHSTAAILPDARVMVAGSNTNNGYQYKVEFPTELRIEKFSPPYLEPAKLNNRLQIVAGGTTTAMAYNGPVKIQVQSPNLHKLDITKLQVTMYSPPFTTHANSMNQRLIELAVLQVNALTIITTAPPSGAIAPPGYYMLFVNYAGVPSVAVWVHIK